MSLTAQRSQGLLLMLLFGFGVLIGVAVAPTLSYHARADPQAVWQAAHRRVRAAGYATRRDLSGLARALFWTLIGLITLLRWLLR